MDEMKVITFEDIERGDAAFCADRANIVAKNAVTSKGVRGVAKVPEAAALNTATFDIEVKQGARTDQERSGRCWMFASLNTMRTRVMKKYGVKEFELSQA
ncbi:MAG: C1 family peptidase, partial [Coriobacteriaceae bacterium]|nr:C1 family peptidase [Coriobacteriaceae bacterium]